MPRKPKAKNDAASVALMTRTEPPKPGEILDKDAYQAALESGTLTEIKEYFGEYFDQQTKPNIAFVGQKLNREALRKISDGMDTIRLPEDQTKPFFHKDAARIVQIAPELYKPVIDK